MKHNWKLQLLGISKWSLRRQDLLSEKIPIIIPAYVKLLIIANQLPPNNNQLISDVIHVMNLKTHQLLFITPEQLIPVLDTINCNCWWIGVTSMRSIRGISLNSPPLSVLQVDAVAKYELWSMICSKCLN